jgi:predicted phosphodiesterase
MRLRIFSDLHREFWAHPADGGSVEEPPLATDADLIILAGDTDVGVRGIRWAKEAFGSTLVIYVAGNHEHYGEQTGRLHEKLRAEASGSSITVLENESVEMGGYRFFGATLWTDFNLYGARDIAMITAGDRTSGMSDFKRIRVRPAYRRFRPTDAAALHAASRQILSRFLAAGDPSRTFVITHYAPSARSLRTHGAHRDAFDPAYASDLEALIHECRPALWIHGHVHVFKDYKVAETRVLANPRGYPGEDTGFARILRFGFDDTLHRRPSVNPGMRRAPNEQNRVMRDIEKYIAARKARNPKAWENFDENYRRYVQREELADKSETDVQRMHLEEIRRRRSNVRSGASRLIEGKDASAKLGKLRRPELNPMAGAGPTDRGVRPTRGQLPQGAQLGPFGKRSGSADVLPCEGWGGRAAECRERGNFAAKKWFRRSPGRFSQLQWCSSER